MNNESEVNILLSSAGRRSYLVDFFKQAIGGCGKVYAANSTRISTALEAADEAVITPLIYDEGYVPYLLRFCKEKQIHAIIPLFDIDLPVLAEYKKEFQKIGTRCIVADKSILEICNDKWRSMLFFEKCGFNVIPSYLNLNAALHDLSEGKLAYPVIIKPRWGMGSIAVYEADNEDELMTLFKKVQEDIFKSYLKFESKEDINNCVLIQKKLDGQEYGIDNICDLDGNYITTIVRKKIGMRSGETDCAQIVNDQKIKEFGRQLASYTKHIANMDVDLFVVDGKIFPLEMNARFGGGYPFSHVAGINLPAAIIKWLRNEKLGDELYNEKIGMVIQKDISMRILNVVGEM